MGRAKQKFPHRLSARATCWLQLHRDLPRLGANAATYGSIETFTTPALQTNRLDYATTAIALEEYAGARRRYNCSPQSQGEPVKRVYSYKVYSCKAEEMLALLMPEEPGRRKRELAATSPPATRTWGLRCNP